MQTDLSTSVFEQPARARAAWLKRCARAGRAHQAGRASKALHNALNLGVTAVLLGAGAGLVLLARVAPAAPYLLLAGPSFGLLYFAALAIVVHEASHDMFLLGPSPAWTRRLGRVFGWACSIPFAIHYEKHWERGHAVHHLRPIEPDDPQQYNRATGVDLARTVAALALVPGYAWVHRFRPAGAATDSRSAPWVKVAFFALWAVVLPLAARVGGLPAAVALLWGLQILPALNQIKGALEHGGPIATDPEPMLRSRSTLPPLRGLFGLLNVTVYHFEHHLHPRVPWYRLPAFHRDVRALVPPALAPVVFNRDVVGQLAGRLGRNEWTG